jgi:CelD/BcsL family acetyltransferase involved in cellulose biosynthesis
LQVDGQAVAFNYNYCYQGRLFGLRMGFLDRPEFSGAGSVLLQKMIQDSCQRGDESIDLGSKYLDCKRHWATAVRTSYRYSHFPATALRAQALRAKRWVRRMLIGEENPLADDKNGRAAAYSS